MRAQGATLTQGSVASVPMGGLMTSLPQDLSCYSGPPAVTVSHSRLDHAGAAGQGRLPVARVLFRGAPQLLPLALHSALRRIPALVRTLQCSMQHIQCSCMASTLSACTPHAHRPVAHVSPSYQPLCTIERLLTPHRSVVHVSLLPTSTAYCSLPTGRSCMSSSYQQVLPGRSLPTGRWNGRRGFWNGSHGSGACGRSRAGIGTALGAELAT